MATGDQLKSLIKSGLEDDKDRFITAALQVAAHEARQGHGALAKELRSLIDKVKISRVKVIPFTPDLKDLVLSTEPGDRLSDLVVSDALKNRIEKILNEYHHKEKLFKHGLHNRRKILLVGPPGTGKTMTASVIAKELGMPFYTVQMDKLVNKFMGETSAKLRQIFDVIKDRKGIFLFDEFDAIGAERNADNDVGEMRRVLNSFLQFIENDKSESFIIAATNNLSILDQALFRRFDDILHYDLPDEKEIKSLIENCLGSYKGTLSIKKVTVESKDLSHAEITQACRDAIKEVILKDKSKVNMSLLKSMIDDRKNAYKRD